MNKFSLKIILRQLAKNKLYTIVNVLGLSVGIAGFLIISLYLLNELSYDNWQENGDRIYRMAVERQMPDRTFSAAKIPHSVGVHLKTAFPEVKEFCRFYKWRSFPVLLKESGIVHEEHEAMFADSTFFDVFSLNLKEGNSDNVLKNPNSIVLTEKLSKKYFGNQNPVGKTIKILPDGSRLWDGNVDLTVTGVCENVPKNTHFSFDLIISSSNINFTKSTDYVNYTAYTYLLLKPETNVENFNEKFPETVAKFSAGQLQRENNNAVFTENKDNGYRYFLQPLRDIYLNSDLMGELQTNGSRRKIKLYSAIAFFILLIAVINYMNLATAKSADRIREVGIQKTLGSNRFQLGIRFLTEAVILCGLSFLFAGLWLWFGLPIFGEHSGQDFSFGQFLNWKLLPIYAGFILILGLLAGSYPAFLMSSFKPTQLVKSSLTKTGKSFNLRNGLIIFQFAVSVFLFISTIVIYRQVVFIQNKDLGFDKDQILVIEGTRFLEKSQIEGLKNQLAAFPETDCVGSGYGMPGGNVFRISFEPRGDKETVSGNGLIIDDYYPDCMNMKLLAGRTFSEDPTDTLAVIINQAAAKALGMDEPVGKQLISRDRFLQRDAEEPPIYTIIGLVKDFNFSSLKDEIAPFFFVHNKLAGGVDRMVYAKVNTTEMLPLIHKIETVWKGISSERPLNVTFLDEDLAALYASEQTFKKLFTAFSFLAIFIACIGLFGLVAYITEKRAKEISVRKVLGASVENILQLLLKDFFKLSVWAFILAIPFAWYFMNKWLENFAYRIEMEWWMFAVAGLLGVLITVLTVSFHSVKVATAHPIGGIREE